MFVNTSEKRKKKDKAIYFKAIQHFVQLLSQIFLHYHTNSHKQKRRLK